MTVTSFVVAILCQIAFHYLKPHLPCRWGTKVGMMTQREFSEMSTRRMKYYRVIFFETPGRKMGIVSNTGGEGFHRLEVENGPTRIQKEKTNTQKNKNAEIEYSPYLKIAESKT